MNKIIYLFIILILVNIFNHDYTSLLQNTVFICSILFIRFIINTFVKWVKKEYPDVKFLTLKNIIIQKK